MQVNKQFFVLINGIINSIVNNTLAVNVPYLKHYLQNA